MTAFCQDSDSGKSFSPNTPTGHSQNVLLHGLGKATVVKPLPFSSPVLVRKPIAQFQHDNQITTFTVHASDIFIPF
jgi:hypothetical protein